MQEIFGVTDHIKRVADQFAAEGFKSIAPAMFDRVERGVTLDVCGDREGPRVHAASSSGRTRSRTSRPPPSSVRAAGSVAVVGFCWGGTVAHVAASELDFDAAVSYYGGGVAKMLDKQPRCPIMYHFGDQDHVDSARRHREDQSRVPGRSRCTSTRARATASIATSAAATARRTRGSRSARSIEFLREQRRVSGLARAVFFDLRML